jgi:hypothetical protein
MGNSNFMGHLLRRNAICKNTELRSNRMKYAVYQMRKGRSFVIAQFVTKFDAEDFINSQGTGIYEYEIKEI